MSKFVHIENHILNTDFIVSISEIQEQDPDDLVIEGKSIYNVNNRSAKSNKILIRMRDGEEIIVRTSLKTINHELILS